MGELLKKRWFQVVGTILLLSAFSIAYYKFMDREIPEPKNIVADLCGEKITRLEYQTHIRRRTQRVYQKDGMLRGSDQFSIRLYVFRALSNDKLLNRLGNELKIEVTPKEIDERIKLIKDQLEHPDKEYAFSLFLEMGGYGSGTEGLAQLREDLRLEILEQKIANAKFPIDGPEFEITDSEVRDFIPTKRLQQIYFAVDPSRELSQDINEASAKMMDRAQEVYEQAAADPANEELFGKLAVQYSMEPQAAARGYIGWVSKGIVTAKFWENVKDLEPNQVSRPFITEAGVHLVRCVETAGPGDKVYETYKDVIRVRLQFKKQKSRFASWFLEQITKMHDENCVSIYDDFLLAIKYEAEGDIAKAIEHLRRAAGQESQNPYFQVQLGKLLARQNNREDALMAYRKATEMAPRDPYVFFELGSAYMEYGDVEKAIREYRKSSDLARLDPEIHNRLEKIYSSMGLLAETDEEHSRYLHAIQLRVPKDAQDRLEQDLPGDNRMLQPPPETLMPEMGAPMAPDMELPEMRPPGAAGSQ